jgi:hypothetical protein
MWPVGWETLEQWGEDVVRIEPLTGGVGVNEVWSVRVNGHLAVGRLGQRSDADLAWETDLLRHLDREGMPVPVPVPTTAGPHGKLPSAGTPPGQTSSQSSGSPRFERSEQQRIDRAHPQLLGMLTTGSPDGIDTTGNPAVLQTLMSFTGEPDPSFAITTP